MLWHREKSDNTIPALDGLRALAVALVLFDHLCIAGSLPFQQSMVDFGNLGVRVFFVISGFIITTLLLREKGRTGGISLPGFYTRRAFRILPIWCCYFLGVLVLLILTHRTPSLRDLLSSLTFNNDYFRSHTIEFDHFWSLGVEEKFYILWPCLVLLLSTRAAGWLALSTVIIVPILRAHAFLAGASYEQLLWPFHLSSDAMAIGCLLAIRRFDKTSLCRWRLNTRHALLSTVLLLALAATHKAGLMFWLVGITVMNFCIAVIIDGLISDSKSRLTRLLDSPPLVTIGALSYGLYLFQQPFMFRKKIGPLSLFPVNLIVLFVVAALGYYFIETPARKFGRSLADRLLKSQADISKVEPEVLALEVLKAQYPG